MANLKTSPWIVSFVLFCGNAFAQEKVEVLPPLRIRPTTPNPAPSLPEGKALAISLDTVLRLAQDNNGQIQIARARLDEACLKNEIAGRAWLPEITVGPSATRHEGGIQDFQGRLVRSSYGALFGGVEVRGTLDLRDVTARRIEAERAMVQRRGELSKLSMEQLLDASSTYVDLLAAQAAITSESRSGRLTSGANAARSAARSSPLASSAPASGERTRRNERTLKLMRDRHMRHGMHRKRLREERRGRIDG